MNLDSMARNLLRCSNGALAGFARALQARQDDASAGIRGQIAALLQAIRPCHGCARKKFRWPQQKKVCVSDLCRVEPALRLPKGTAGLARGNGYRVPSDNRLFWSV